MILADREETRVLRKAITKLEKQGGASKVDIDKLSARLDRVEDAQEDHVERILSLESQVLALTTAVESNSNASPSITPNDTVKMNALNVRLEIYSLITK